MQKSAEFKKEKLLVYFYCWFHGNMRLILVSQQELSASAVKEYIFNNNDSNQRNRIFQNHEENVTNLSSI